MFINVLFKSQNMLINFWKLLREICRIPKKYLCWSLFDGNFKNPNKWRSPIIPKWVKRITKRILQWSGRNGPEFFVKKIGRNFKNLDAGTSQEPGRNLKYFKSQFFQKFQVGTTEIQTSGPKFRNYEHIEFKHYCDKNL